MQVKKCLLENDGMNDTQKETLKQNVKTSDKAKPLESSSESLGKFGGALFWGPYNKDPTI